MSSEILHIILKNDIGEMSRLLNRIEQFAQKAGLTPAQTYALKLAVDEAFANAISYGYPQGGEHCISIALTKEKECLSAVLEDDGIPFNPLETPELDFSSQVEDGSVPGLGIHLMRSFMDTITYRREGGKNILTFINDVALGYLTILRFEQS